MHIAAMANAYSCMPHSSYMLFPRYQKSLSYFIPPSVFIAFSANFLLPLQQTNYENLIWEKEN